MLGLIHFLSFEKPVWIPMIGLPQENDESCKTPDWLGRLLCKTNLGNSINSELGLWIRQARSQFFPLSASGKERRKSPWERGNENELKPCFFGFIRIVFDNNNVKCREGIWGIVGHYELQPADSKLIWVKTFEKNKIFMIIETYTDIHHICFLQEVKGNRMK